MPIDLEAAIRATPPVTKTLVASAVGISVLVMARLAPRRLAVYSNREIFQGFQVWRAYTGFFLGGDSGLSGLFLYEVYMLYKYMKRIEKEKYHRRVPDLVWQLICSAAALHGLGALSGWYLGAPDIGSNWTALITFVVHFYSKLCPNDIVPLPDRFQMSVFYLPYAVAALNLIFSGHHGGAMAVSGLIVSQMLYMLAWDSTGGRPTPKADSWLAAPTWFKNLF